MINTIDEDFFISNIREGYRLRKERHADKDHGTIAMDVEMYRILMGSNQIVHNRGRALAYLTGSKKRKDNNGQSDGSPVEEKPPAPRKKPHEYSRA